MKVTFVYPDLFRIDDDYTGEYYSGVASLSASLKAAGHECELIHIFKFEIDREDFLKRIIASKPDLIAFSSTTTMFQLVAKTIAWLDEANVGVPKIVGGVHAILSPLEVIKHPGVDYICQGEGEEMIVEFCEKLEGSGDMSTIRGLGWKKGDEVILNEQCRYISQLDELAVPDRSIFDFSSLYNERQGTAPIVASRGCPYKCTYCCNAALREAKGNGKPAIRFHSVDYVINEANQIVNDYDFINTLMFDDDILFLNNVWAKEFADRFPKEVGLPFISNLRPNMATEETISLLKKAGCQEVKIGLESGNDYMRNTVLNRKLTREHIINAVKMCKKYDLKVLTFNMLGLPHETPRMILDTIKLNAEANPDRLQHSTFYPFAGTRLYEECRENNFISDRSNYDIFSDSILNQPTISKRQVKMFQRWFDQLVQVYHILYKLPGPISKMSQKVLDFIVTSRAGNLFIDYFLHLLRLFFLAGKRLGSSKKADGKVSPEAQGQAN